MEKPITKRSFIVGLLIIFVSAYSQYLIKGLGPLPGMIVVYGIPVFVVSWLWGSRILSGALEGTKDAIRNGLGFFGSFTLLGTFIATVIFSIITSLDPAASNLLHRPNPVLHVSPEFAWIMVVVSFLVIGPVEEYIFRGFIFGGLLSLSRQRHWLSMSLISSILFAAAHLYYAFVYGIASVIQFTDLVAFGMAMALTYYLSKRNLIGPALIHGAYDATGFVGVATSPLLGAALRGSMILVGLGVGVLLLVQRMRRR